MTGAAAELLHLPERYPRSAGYDPEWLLGLDMGPNPLWLLEDLSRDLGSGMGEWEITELVTVTAARLQEHGFDDWLRWARAGLRRTGSTTNDSVIAMLEADRGELLTFALVAAVKPEGDPRG